MQGSPLGKDVLRERTGLPCIAYFSGTKLAWLLANVAGLREAAEKGDALFGTIETWLMWKLSQGTLHVSDVTNAGRSLLMDISTLEWDTETCALFKVPLCMLPTIVDNSRCFFTCQLNGPLLGVPIGGIIGDQQAALFGQDLF